LRKLNVYLFYGWRRKIKILILIFIIGDLILIHARVLSLSLLVSLLLVFFIFREMIFWQPLFDNFLSHTHMMLLFSLFLFLSSLFLINKKWEKQGCQQSCHQMDVKISLLLFLSWHSSLCWIELFASLIYLISVLSIKLFEHLRIMHLWTQIIRQLIDISYFLKLICDEVLTLDLT
jgi:hypothetical protein